MKLLTVFSMLGAWYDFAVDAYNNVIGWIRGIDTWIKWSIAAGLAVVICLCVIKYLKKSVNKDDIKWRPIVLAVVCLLIIALLFI